MGLCQWAEAEQAVLLRWEWVLKSRLRRVLCHMSDWELWEVVE